MGLVSPPQDIATHKSFIWYPADEILRNVMMNVELRKMTLTLGKGILLDPCHSNCNSLLWENSCYFKDVILQQRWNKLMTSINEGHQG